MSLFGQKCIRCDARRTKREYEGLPTCEACEKEIRARGRAANEDRRVCPVDGSVMGKDVVLNVIIDRCESCNGVWLDGGEFDLIRSTITEAVVMDLARTPF